MLTTHRGIQVLQIREALCWRAWCLALTSVFSTGILQQDCRAMPSQVPRCLISISFSYHFYQLADVDEPRLRPSTNPH